MNAKGTPIEIDPTGTVRLNDSEMQVYQEPVDLPCDPEKRALCAEHIASGLGDQMFSDFWMEGCDFPVAQKEGVVRVQLSCNGESAFRKLCRLTLTQYDTHGKVLNTGKFRERIE